ncbi:hypothetical protein LTR41_001587 [Exophiala xenobiotica]|nr:hypothetical protein LTR41_001587 [Exophiala xenobiotica]
MPEIGEVARTVHYIRKLLVGKTISKVIANEDPNVFGKAGCSAGDFQKHMTGKKVVDAGQQGKYFWMIMSSPPHPVMHFGMSGWLKFKDEHTYYYRPKEGEENNEPWPPKFMKFLLETNPENEGQEKNVEAAFVDMRRFARIRLVDCPGGEIRENTPLKENGPDPVIDKDVVTVEWLKKKCQAKKVPIKAMLLDQANISGIGNWVGDEIMYNAKMHPEQYANTLSDEQIEQLHKSIQYVCNTAVELLADSEQFPDDWLFKHRWQKGKKNASNTLPNGAKIAFLTVGGRTSAVVPSVQKKTGPVAKEMDEAEVLDDDDEKKPKAKGKKRKAVAEDDEDEEEEAMPKKTTARGRKAQVKEEAKVEGKPEVNGHSKSVKAKGKGKKVKEEPADTDKKTGREKAVVADPDKAATTDTSKRRSGRLSKP